MMDRGKRPSNLLGAMMNYKIYMELKDIVREHALCFLPAKSLFRFQSVCRDWKQQISTPFFAHNQSLAFHTALGFFCQTRGNAASFVACDPKSCGVPDPSLGFLPEPVDIRSSSNGLLCCQARTGDRAYYICNPATKQWKQLPKPNADHGSESSAVIIFQPSLLNFVAEYKVVCAFQSTDFDDALEFEIYSSTENSWKVSGEICFVSGSVSPLAGVHVNNVIYWKFKKGSCGSAMIVYDVTKDRSQLLQDYYLRAGSLGCLNGKLCLAAVSGRTLVVNILANVHSNTMAMDSRAKMWEQVRRTMFDSKVIGEDGCDAVVMVADNILVMKNESKMYSFDLKTEEIKELGSASVCKGAVCIPYVNSLVNIWVFLLPQQLVLVLLSVLSFIIIQSLNQVVLYY